VRHVDKRWIRVLGFATIYFFLFVISAILFMIKSLSGSSQITEYFQYYIQNPLKIILIMFAELTQSPLLMLTLLSLILLSLILGFITDQVLHILLRKRQLRIDFDQPKN